MLSFCVKAFKSNSQSHRFSKNGANLTAQRLPSIIIENKSVLNKNLLLVLI